MRKLGQNGPELVKKKDAEPEMGYCPLSIRQGAQVRRRTGRAGAQAGHAERWGSGALGPGARRAGGVGRVAGTRAGSRHGTGARHGC